jgi:hypothetical protein
MSASFMTQLGESSDLLAFDDRQITAGHLNQGAGDRAHDQSKEERIALFPSTTQICHE